MELNKRLVESGYDPDRFTHETKEGLLKMDWIGELICHSSLPSLPGSLSGILFIIASDSVAHFSSFLFSHNAGPGIPSQAAGNYSKTQIVVFNALNQLVFVPSPATAIPTGSPKSVLGFSFIAFVAIPGEDGKSFDLLCLNRLNTLVRLDRLDFKVTHAAHHEDSEWFREREEKGEIM